MSTEKVVTEDGKMEITKRLLRDRVLAGLTACSRQNDITDIPSECYRCPYTDKKNCESALMLDALELIRELEARAVTVNQNGSSNTHITNVGTLIIN